MKYKRANLWTDSDMGCSRSNGNNLNTSQNSLEDKTKHIQRT